MPSAIMLNVITECHDAPCLQESEVEVGATPFRQLAFRQQLLN